MLFLAVDYLAAFVNGLGLNGALGNIITFVLLGAVCFLLILFIKYGVGAHILYEVRSEDYYKEKHQEVEKMKQQVKKHNKREKK